jgi:hypothetical protein
VTGPCPRLRVSPALHSRHPEDFAGPEAVAPAIEDLPSAKKSD